MQCCRFSLRWGLHQHHRGWASLAPLLQLHGFTVLSMGPTMLKQLDFSGPAPFLPALTRQARADEKGSLLCHIGWRGTRAQRAEP